MSASGVCVYVCGCVGVCVPSTQYIIIYTCGYHTVFSLMQTEVFGGAEE